MAYFQELPNISYPSLLSANNKVEDRIIVKNLFKRSKLRSDVDQAITAFNYYYSDEKRETRLYLNYNRNVRKRIVLFWGSVFRP